MGTGRVKTVNPWSTHRPNINKEHRKTEAIENCCVEHNGNTKGNENVHTTKSGLILL